MKRYISFLMGSLLTVTGLVQEVTAYELVVQPNGTSTELLLEGEAPDIANIPCPYCDSAQTDLESIFGPTLCRSIHYCRDCQQSFEHFKAV